MSKSKFFETNHLPPQRGLSLVELMVGLAIGMILFLAITSVFSNFESQKRITSSTSDAQSSSALAILDIEQALRSAGAGIIEPPSSINQPGIKKPQDCAPANTYSYHKQGSLIQGSHETVKIPGFSQSHFSPAIITDGGTTGSDSIDILIGAAVAGAVPATLEQALKPADTEFTVMRDGGFPTNQVLIMVMQASPNKCLVLQVTGYPDTTSSEAKKRMSMTTDPDPDGNIWNPGAAYKTTKGWSETFPRGSLVYAPGTIVSRSLSINSNMQLQSTNGSAAGSTTEIISADIVSLQAQYGVSSAAGNMNISNWVQPTSSAGWDAASIDAAKASRILAIRVAIVMRTPKMEGGNVTSTCTNNAGTNKGPCAWQDTTTDPAPLIDLSSNTNWQRYRYRVFQTIIPLRNVLPSN